MVTPEHCLNVLGTAAIQYMVSLGHPKQGKLEENMLGTENILKSILKQQRLVQSRECYGNRNDKTTNTSFSFFLSAANHCSGSAPLGLTRLCGPAVGDWVSFH